MKAKHTPGPWKVMADPVYGGRHPLQDARWITTADTELKPDPRQEPESWCLSKGSLICQMRDTEHQPHDARLIAAAPELLEACKYSLELIKTARQYFPKSIRNSNKFQLENTCAAIEKAIKKATDT